MPKDSNTKPKSWRDQIEVHPAADIYPLLGPDELQKLGADIEANGLRAPIVLWAENENRVEVLLDGRNRLDAMEARGLQIVEWDQAKGRLFWHVPTRRYLGAGGGGTSMLDGLAFALRNADCAKEFRISIAPSAEPRGIDGGTGSDQRQGRLSMADELKHE